MAPFCTISLERELLFSDFVWSHRYLLWCCTLRCWFCSPFIYSAGRAPVIVHPARAGCSSAMKRHLALGKDKFTFYLTSLMLVIPTSSTIDSWICADYSTNGQQLVGGISQPCGAGFPEDALSDLCVPSSCNPVTTEVCDLHAISWAGK